MLLYPAVRNAAIVHTLAQYRGLHLLLCNRRTQCRILCYRVIVTGGGPAAVCCTSGSALLNLHPAVAEAFYQQVPLIVISADRPAAWIGQMDGQTLPQPGYSVRWSRCRSTYPKCKPTKTNGSATV